VKSVVSSQVSQLRHGVGPPAQFRMVPLKLSSVSTSSPRSPSKMSVVVPPDAPPS
jgi:hypothetical protein